MAENQNPDAKTPAPEASGAPAIPNSPVQGSDSSPKPPEDTGVDWRILLILGIIVIFLIAVVVNRKYHSKKAPIAEPKETAAESEKTVQPQKKLSPAEQFERLIQARREEVKNTLYHLEERRLLLARPPIHRPPKSADEPMAFEPGIFFDVTNCLPDIDPLSFYRRGYFAEETSIAFWKDFPALGLAESPKMVFKPAAEVQPDAVADEEIIIGIAVNNAARAYPLKVMYIYDVINDTVGGTDIAISWNAFALAATAFERPTIDQTRLFFESSSMLYQQANLIYDTPHELPQDKLRQTGSSSLWSPTIRLALSGKHRGTTLKPVQSFLMKWTDWKKQHPGTDVLAATEPPLITAINPSVPRNYYGTEVILYPVSNLDVANTPMPLKKRIMGVTAPDGSTKAYELSLLAEKKDEFEDEINGQKIRLRYYPETVTLVATTADGQPLLSEHMYWLAWIGAHPKTEVWQEEILRGRLYPPQAQEQIPAADTDAVQSPAAQ